MGSTKSPLKAAPAKLRITLFTFSLLPTSSSRIGEPKDFSRYRAEEQDHPPLGGVGQRFRQAQPRGMVSGGLRPLRRANGLGERDPSGPPPLRRLFHPASPDATFSQLRPSHPRRAIRHRRRRLRARASASPGPRLPTSNVSDLGLSNFASRKRPTCIIGQWRERLADATLKTFAARLDRGATNSPGESQMRGWDHSSA
jgi:hypothetical protein